jgi:hypothetical protein
MRWKVWRRRVDTSGQRDQAGCSATSTIHDSKLQFELERRGVTCEYSRLLSGRLEQGLAGRSQQEATAVLDGIGIAFSVQQETSQQLAESVRGLKEMERIMGAFSGELSKLDEVLEVLAAYVRRMRTSGPPDEPTRTLH